MQIDKPAAVVIVSADAEWTAVRSLFPCAEYLTSPFGEYFQYDGLVVFHGGWGKIAAAASTQYVIDHWQPDTIINIGTCGGVAGAIDRFSIVLATRTVVYDIGELMGDSQEAIDAYSTDIDLAWLGDEMPTPVIRTALLSADRDLFLARSKCSEASSTSRRSIGNQALSRGSPNGIVSVC